MREPEEGLTSLEALGLAIRAEMDAIDIYHELAEGATVRLSADASSSWRRKRSSTEPTWSRSGRTWPAGSS